MAQITYTNKETLNSQPSIADKNKVTSSDMNEIKSVVNTNYGEVGDITNLTTTDKTSVVNAINELKGGEVYSTSEVKTNKVWINGKPIYRKVFITKWVNINLTNLNIDTMTDIRGLASYSNGWHPLNAYANANFYSLVQYTSTEKQIQFYGNGYSNSNIILIIEYTKTTD